MEQQTDQQQIVKQLKVIKWLLIGVLVCALLAVISFVAMAVVSVQLTGEAFSEMSAQDCTSDASFEDDVDDLIDDASFGEAIARSKQYVKDNPSDEDGFWYLGIAHYLNGDWREAIDAMKIVEGLEPSWKQRWTSPYIDSAMLQLANSNQLDK